MVTKQIIFPITTKQFLVVIIISALAFVWAYKLFATKEMTSKELCEKEYITQVESVNEDNWVLTNMCVVNYSNSWAQLKNCLDKLKLSPVNNCREANEKEEITLRSKFGLANCRFINESHKIPKYNLEWMAYDIACEVGKSFDVKSPWLYTIEEIWYWANLGNYVILRWVVAWSMIITNDTRIVLGHTITTRKQWEIIDKGDIIWQTNISWASSWIHVHIELFQWYNNVSREFALGEKYKSMDGTRLLNHRGWDFWQKSDKYGIIKELECKNWFHLESYWDYKQYSIGCGTKSVKGEVITEAEAYERFTKEVDRRYDIVEKTFKDYSFNQKIALTSLLYNNPECYNHFRDNGIDMNIWKNKCNKAGSEVLRWLQIRRDKEVELFNS